jgi:hypothetical protein
VGFSGFTYSKSSLLRLLTVPEILLTELLKRELGLRDMSRTPNSTREKMRRKEAVGRFTNLK